MIFRRGRIPAGVPRKLLLMSDKSKVGNPDKPKMRKLRIAIDGPAGAGKSTVARMLAQKLGYLYLDTGAMYRALAVTAVDKGIDLNDPVKLGEMARQVDMRVREDNGVFRVWVDGVELTDRLRGPETDRAVKLLAMARPVREVLVAIQRKLAEAGGVVMEGRDITSVVLPDAEVKVFLTASLEERVRRRWKELKDRGIQVEWDEVKEEMVSRDQKDQERTWGRLVQTEDSVFIDSSRMTKEEVCSAIAELCEARTRCCTGS